MGCMLDREKLKDRRAGHTSVPPANPHFLVQEGCVEAALCRVRSCHRYEAEDFELLELHIHLAVGHRCELCIYLQRIQLVDLPSIAMLLDSKNSSAL